MALTAVAAAGPWESGQRTAERAIAASRDGQGEQARPHKKGGGGGHKGAVAPVPPAAPEVLTAVSGPHSTPVPTTSGLAGRLGPLLHDGGLGAVTTGAVVDAVSGRTVWGQSPGTPAVPASTTKVATAVASLSLLGADHRLTTSVVAAGKDRVVLVGGGDPTLTARAKPGGGWTAASLRTLASDTARALRAKGVRSVQLTYDTSLFTGPAVHPIGHNDNIAPVTALMADEGRSDGKSFKGPVARQWDPAASAASVFADLLRGRGIKVVGAVKSGKAPARTRAADLLAEVRSAPLADLVERMLTNSDNDIAEALARHTALAADRPGSFSGGARAIGSALRELGLPLKGARFADGSGLSRADHLTAEQLAGMLALAADPDHPELRPVLTGLPVAGFTGSLRERFTSAGGAAGLVRGKTGTLTGVNALAGTVVDADGRLLTFAFLTNGTTNPVAAQSALDRLAAELATCGCRK
ncbi:D-alanyl-D-alanine carboxypeptidase/D-alanyl-D-alanine endopeptidase [Actinacidiphila sp. bgisy160]|uniref:D-alanyl-D-alanine carboxypeptidase/D-alanyl-D-alanine endopeptidase n=1 Tax=Actinacidiphila sp. bgisy160 TaxID=3413796 RepID=UPI003D73FEC1